MNEKKMKKKTILAVSALIFFFLALGAVLFFHSEIMDRQIKPLDLPFAVHPLVDPETAELSSGNIFRPDVEYGGKTEDVSIRGIYVDVSIMSVEEKRKKLIAYAKKNDINAFLFDIVDEVGNVLYPSFVEEVHAVQKDWKLPYSDLQTVMTELEAEGIIPIARVCAFRISKTREVPSDWVIKNKNGDIWRDHTGHYWLNPASEKVVDYLSSLVKEAVLLGFSEIMLDYVRFPINADRSAVLPEDENERVKVMGDFIASLKKFTVEYSYRLFFATSGRITGMTGERGTGQRLDMISRVTDVFSPMIFPAYYFGGEFGQKYPYAEPYAVLKESVSNALEELKLIDEGKSTMRMCPILQAFSAPWLKPGYREKYVEYGTEEVRAQIRALQECGVQEWILWNRQSMYPNFEN